MGTEEDADKTDVISECERQMGSIKTYLKISEEEWKQCITEIENKLKRIVECHMYKGNWTKNEAGFLMSKMYVYIGKRNREATNCSKI